MANMARAIEGIPVILLAERDTVFPTPERDQRFQDRTTGTQYRHDGVEWVTDFVGPGARAINVKDAPYNAVGDGSTNDASAVQAALTAAGVTGADVIFPAGNFRATSQLTIPSNVRLIGAGREATTLSFVNAGAIGLYATGKTNIAIDGMTIDGNSSLAMGVVFSTCTTVAVRNCHFTGCTSSAHGTQYAGGVHAWVSDDVTIEGNTFSGNGYIGAGLSSDVQINGNGNNTGSERIRIVGNRCLSTAVQTNIVAYDIQHSEISGNVCSGAKTGAGNNNGYGIATYKTVAMTGSFMRDNRIENNTVYAVGGTGIYVQSVTRTVVSGNAVQDAGAVQDDTTLPVGGISVINSSDVTVTGNTLTACQKSGIAVGGTPCTGHVIADNVIDTVTGIGIHIRGALTGTITGNVIKSASTKGIATLPTETGLVGCVIADNVIDTTGDRAVDLYGISKSTIANNVITASGKNGLSIAGTSSALNVIEGNVILDGGTVTTNTYSAIELAACVKSTVRGNLVGNSGATGYKYGFTIPASNTTTTVSNNAAFACLTTNYNLDTTLIAGTGLQVAGNYDSSSSFPQAFTMRQQAQMTGAASSVTQMLMGSSGAIGALGTRWSGGDAYLATNAYHVLGSDLWHQSAAATSKLVILRVNGDIEFYHAANGTADATFATFWGTAKHAFTSTGALKVSGTQVLGAQQASASQAAVTIANTDNAIGGLTISAAYSQAEVQALRAACEVLADDVRALSTLVHAIRSAGVSHGFIKGSA